MKGLSEDQSEGLCAAVDTKAVRMKMLVMWQLLGRLGRHW